MSSVWYLLHLTGWWSPAQCAHTHTHTVYLCGMVSHLKATLLDVVELQAKRLYAAYDSPLVTNQTDPDAPDVAKGEKTNIMTNTPTPTTKMFVCLLQGYSD